METVNSHNEPRRLGLLRIRKCYVTPQTIKEASISLQLAKTFVGFGVSDWLVSDEKDFVTYLCESKHFDIVMEKAPVPDYVVFFHDDIDGNPFLTYIKKSEQL